MLIFMIHSRVRSFQVFLLFSGQIWSQHVIQQQVPILAEHFTSKLSPIQQIHILRIQWRKLANDLSTVLDEISNSYDRCINRNDNINQRNFSRWNSIFNCLEINFVQKVNITHLWRDHLNPSLDVNKTQHFIYLFCALHPRFSNLFLLIIMNNGS